MKLCLEVIVIFDKKDVAIDLEEICVTYSVK